MLRELGGIVEYVVGPGPSPGVFVFAEAHDDVQAHYLDYGKLGQRTAVQLLRAVPPDDLRGAADRRPGGRVRRRRDRSRSAGPVVDVDRRRQDRPAGRRDARRPRLVPHLRACARTTTSCAAERPAADGPGRGVRASRATCAQDEPIDVRRRRAAGRAASCTRCAPSRTRMFAPVTRRRRRERQPTSPTTAADVVAADMAAICDGAADELAGDGRRRLLIVGGGGLPRATTSSRPSLALEPARRRDAPIAVTVFDNYVRGVPGLARRARRRRPEPHAASGTTSPSRCPPTWATSTTSSTPRRSPRRSTTASIPIETMDANVSGLRRLLDYARRQRRGRQARRGLPLLLEQRDLRRSRRPRTSRRPRPTAATSPAPVRGPATTSPSATARRCASTSPQQHGLPVTVARPFNNYGPGLKITDRPRASPTSPATSSPAATSCMLSDGAADADLLLRRRRRRRLLQGAGAAAAPARPTTSASRRPRSRWPSWPTRVAALGARAVRLHAARWSRRHQRRRRLPGRQPQPPLPGHRQGADRARLRARRRRWTKACGAR